MKNLMFFLQMLTGSVLFAMPNLWDAYFYQENDLRSFATPEFNNGKPLFPDGRKMAHRTVKAVNGILDLDAAAPAGMNRAVLVGKFTSPDARSCYFGVGAAAFTVRLNGKTVYDFLQRGLGNDFSPVSGKDHIFPVDLQKSSNTIVIDTFKTHWKLDYCYGKNRHNPWQLAVMQHADYQPIKAKLAHEPLFTTHADGKLMVTFITADPVAAGIDYRPAGSGKWQRQWDLAGELVLRENTRIHRIVLDEILPDRDYEYRIVMLEPPVGTDGKRRALWTTRQYREVISDIRTLRLGKRDDFRFVLFGDTQLSISETLRTVDDRRQILQRMFQSKAFKEADFRVIIGDLTSYAHDIEKDMFTGYFDLLTSDVDLPWVYVRGNHEPNGLGSEAWYDYFAMPGGKSYYAFRRGETLFIVLDCGDFTVGTTKSYSGPIIDQKYLLKQQRKWLAKIKNTPEYRSAKFRIVLSHTEPSLNADPFSIENRKMMLPLLQDTSKEGMIHLWLAGHIHTYCRANRGESTFLAVSERKTTALKYAPVTFVTVDGPKGSGMAPDLSYLSVHVKGDAISVTAFDENNRKLDEFSIQESGEVKNIFKADHLKYFPMPGQK